MKPKILICDNNTLQRQNLIDFLHELEISMDIYESENKEDILNKVQNKNVDILITDIVMQNINMCEVIKKIREDHPFLFVVFVTAYKDYVMEAVTECHCYDYISKPVNKERFQATVRLLLEKMTQEKQLSNSKQGKKNLLINYNNESFVIPMDEILFIEQQGYLSIIHTTSGIYQCVSTLIHLYNELDENFFLSHKSFLVNIKNVHYVSFSRKSSSDIFFHKYNQPALLSVRKKAEFKKLLSQYNKL